MCLCYLGEKYEQVTNVQFYKCTINHWFYSPNILITSVIYTLKRVQIGEPCYFSHFFYCLLTTKQAPFYILYGLLQVNNLQKFPFRSALYFDSFFNRLSFRIMSNSLDSQKTKSLETKTVIFFVKTNSLQFFF